MGLFDKHRHKKCIEKYNYVYNALKDGNRHSCVFFLDSTKGYEELWDLLKNNGYEYKMDTTGRESVYVEVKKQGDSLSEKI